VSDRAARARPIASPRVIEGLKRLVHNTDFIALREHLEAEHAYMTRQCVTSTEGQNIARMQGRTMQLDDLLDIIKSAKD
jgi:hypothetical protein